MSDTSEDGNVSWQADVDRFQEVLNEEKDLSKNFKKDLIMALELLSQECTVDEDAPSLINFTLAGIVINASANVYGRKVDYIHDLTRILRSHLIAQTCQDDDDSSPNRRRKKDFEFVEVINSEEDHSKLDWSLEKHTFKKVKPTLTTLPLALLPLQDTEKNDSPLVSVMGEVIGQRLDLLMNRFCANRTDIVLCHRYLEGQSDESEHSCMQNGCANDSDSDDDNDDDPPPMDIDAIPCVNNIPNFNFSETEIVTHNLPNLHENDAECPPQLLTKILEKKADEPKTKRKCVALELMDPYEVLTRQERAASLRCRTLPRLTQNMNLSPVKKVRKDKRRYSSSSDENGKNIKPEPFWEFFHKLNDGLVRKKNFKDPPYFESLNELAYKETLERRRIDAKDKANCLSECRDDVEEGELELNDNNERSEESDEEIPPFQINDHEQNGVDVHENGPSPLPPFQINEDAKIFSSVMASNLHDLYEKASNSQRSTDLLERVGAWNSHINPILEEERLRRNFDAKVYQEDILKSFGDKDGISFRNVVKPKEVFEASRYFVSALFLVNNGNIEFLPTNPEKVTNDVEIRLIF